MASVGLIIFREFKLNSNERITNKIIDPRGGQSLSDFPLCIMIKKTKGILTGHKESLSQF